MTELDFLSLRQTTSAGSGELPQVAISLSAFLPIEIVPPGHVTETSFLAVTAEQLALGVARRFVEGPAGRAALRVLCSFKIC